MNKLKSDQFQFNKRCQEAGSVPFRSLRMGRPPTLDEAVANGRLQGALSHLQASSFKLPTRLLPRAGPNGPPTNWGPFVFGIENMPPPRFGRMTDIAVKKFQTQANLEADGKAGMATMQKLDQLLVELQKLP
jgi:peptidoglycan hydrolase-like protein with peptidoglycan-binding domain